MSKSELPSVTIEDEECRAMFVPCFATPRPMDEEHLVALLAALDPDVRKAVLGPYLSAAVEQGIQAGRAHGNHKIAALQRELEQEREGRVRALESALSEVYGLKRRFGLVDAKDVGAQEALTLAVEKLTRMVLDARKKPDGEAAK